MGRLVLGIKLLVLGAMFAVMMLVMNWDSFQLLPTTFAVFSSLLILAAFAAYLLRYSIGGVYAILGFSLLSSMICFLLSLEFNFLALIAILLSSASVAILHTDWIVETKFPWRLTVRAYRVLMSLSIFGIVLVLAPWLWGSLACSSIFPYYPMVVGGLFLLTSVLLLVFSAKMFAAGLACRRRVFSWSIVYFFVLSSLPAQMSFLFGTGSGFAFLIWAIVFILFFDIVLAPTLVFLLSCAGLGVESVVLHQGSNPEQGAFDSVRSAPVLPAISGLIPPLNDIVGLGRSKEDLPRLEPQATGSFSHVDGVVAVSEPSAEVHVMEEDDEAAVVSEISYAPTQAYAQPKLDEIDAYLDAYKAQQEEKK